MENFSEIFVSGLGDSASDVIGGKSGQKTADRYEFHFRVVDVYDYASAEAVISVYKHIEQCLAQRFLGIVAFFDPLKSAEGCGGFVA